ncbi:MAG: L-lysine 6-transaminase [Bacteroidia bacterium]|nr:L-lysine 6-transaminase [Bacteroidia bacterium]MDW8158726.1 L-lysine 6-transaminase [Bacteroidia bacterium]
MRYINNIQPQEVKGIMTSHILKDGYEMVMDLKRSQGAYVYDSLRGRQILDFFSCFATIPLGYNHPKMLEDQEFIDNLLQAAIINPSNSDLYTTQYAHFLQTFDRVGIPEYLPHAFFIAGGALAVENALKVAMDWKVQKNFEKGYTYEKGTQVLHFQEAFHGRSGYTLSLTNTDINKIKYFAKFEQWPRVLNPKIYFPLDEKSLKDVQRREALALNQIKMAFQTHRDDICAIIIEPIQCEGGDNHFRTEFMEALRQLCDENECLLIYDEVQVGMCATGKFWAHEHFGPKARPDIIAFGKKMQICGILAGPKVDEVENNCFRVSSRINSTWGGNLVDMVRADKILQIIEEDNILENVQQSGNYLLEGLHNLAHKYPQVTNVRGKGLICAFDLPTKAIRDAFIKVGLENDAMFLGCAEKSIRFRPTLTITKQEIDTGLAIMDKVLSEILK